MKDRTIKTRSNKDEADNLDKIISSSYDDFVRLERRNLLIISSITLISFFGNVKPENLKLLGITFPELSASMLFVALNIACLYFLTAFIIYAYPGYRASSKEWKKISSNTITITAQLSWFHIEKDNLLSSTRYSVWLLFNYFLPVLIGVIAFLAGVYEIA